ncbi:hypothetical protein BSU04_15285 [Caballeronia sordidicola]|uniref:Uncharacterized protein n=1 Tax=Caballeronia sordidicola TaxID=196367 RepID=A0A226X321_CABSO|nr:hypothetical protein BSU04_15285 [Caballeronia sordidicola]
MFFESLENARRSPPRRALKQIAEPSLLFKLSFLSAVRNRSY